MARKYSRIFVRGHEKRAVFREGRSRKTVSSEEQIMSKDKYLSIFSPQMEAIVFIILQIVFATRAVFKIGEYSRIFPSFSWGIFGHVTCLDTSKKYLMDYNSGKLFVKVKRIVIQHMEMCLWKHSQAFRQMFCCEQF